MKFLNKKEEVIDMQLTRKGIECLSEGEFQPFYYSFLDDNILYDYSYSSEQEVEGGIGDKIESETSFLQTQYNFEKEKNQEDSEGRSYTPQSIGTSEVGNKYLPSFNLKMLDGKIQETKRVATSKDFVTRDGEKITQIPVSVIVDVEVRTPSKGKTIMPTRFGESIDSIPAKDGTFLSITSNSMLIDLIEENTEESTENFDIEVFEVFLSKPSKGSSFSKDPDYEIKRKIMFREKTKYVKNGILLDSPERDTGTSISPTEEDFTHYFSMLKDHDISSEDLNMSTSRKLIISDIYNSGITDDDIEDCD